MSLPSLPIFGEPTIVTQLPVIELCTLTQAQMQNLADQAEAGNDLNWAILGEQNMRSIFKDVTGLEEISFFIQDGQKTATCGPAGAQAIKTYILE